MKKNWKRKLVWFTIALILTLLVGTVVLATVLQHKKKEKAAWQEQMQAEQIAEINAQTDAETRVQAGAGVQIGSGQDDNTGGADREDASLPEIETDQKEQNPQGEQKTDPAEEKGKAVMTFAGDICFHDAYANMYALSARGGNIESCIGASLLAEMRDADICMINNEFPYSDRGQPVEGKTFTFCSKPGNVKLLSQMGVDIVSLANNHAYDYGQDALLDSLDTLDGEGIARVGAGRNLEEAMAPVYFDINGTKIGILAATQIERLENPDTKGATENSPGVFRCFNETELNRLLEQIKQTKQQCDFLTVYIHWGTENTDELDWAQPYQAKLIAEAGADLIVGCHPHCLQGIDYMGDTPVIYSLGNFWFNSKEVDTALLKVTVQGDTLENIQMIPALQKDCSTNALDGAEGERVINYLQSLSENITIDAEGYISSY